MRFKSRRIRQSAFLAAICATLLIFPFALSAGAMEHGHRYGFRGRIVPAYPAYIGDWGNGWGWGGPFWYNYWPYYYDNTGKIKLEDVSKNDEVFINGSAVGEAKEHKSIRFNPGTYQVTVKNNGKDVIDQKVVVLQGKTIKLEVGDKDGNIKIKDATKTDSVYINGFDKGEVKDLGNIYLRPGTYQVTVMNHGRETLNQQVIVPMGKTFTLWVGDRS
jgi:hypothetical protein